MSQVLYTSEKCVLQVGAFQVSLGAALFQGNNLVVHASKCTNSSQDMREILAVIFGC